MEKEKQLVMKIESLEEEYRRNRRRVEETMDEVSQEKRQFQRGLEELADYVSYLYKKQENDGTQGQLQQSYRMIGDTQEQGESTVKNTLRKLDNELEDQQLAYKKSVNRYEEELVMLKKEKDW